MNCLPDRYLRSSGRGGKAGTTTGRTPCLPDWVPVTFRDREPAGMVRREVHPRAARVPDVRADNPALRPGRVGDDCPKPTWDTPTGAAGAGRDGHPILRTVEIVEWLTPRHLSPNAHPATDLRPIDAPHGERVEGGCAEWAPKLLGLPPERRRLRRSLRCVDSDHAALTGRCAAEFTSRGSRHRLRPRRRS